MSLGAPLLSGLELAWALHVFVGGRARQRHRLGFVSSEPVGSTYGGSRRGGWIGRIASDSFCGRGRFPLAAFVERAGGCRARDDDLVSVSGTSAGGV